MSIYLDHSATTRPWPAVIDCLTSELALHYANPSSLHRQGQAAASSLEASRQQIAAALGCRKQELLLTSGGSESINTAIKGFVAANPRLGKRIITSRGEHAATVQTLDYLKQQGYEIEELPLRPSGSVDLDALQTALQRPAALISLIHVSNETGAVNDAAAIVRLRNQYQPNTAIHLDAVQTLGRQPLHFQRLGVDLLSGSGHKVGAPKGIGWLLVRQGVRLTPLIHGGGQQQGLRAGTENAPLAAALALAIQLTMQNATGREAEVRELRRLFLQELDAASQPYALISPDDGVPQILTIAFPGLRGETMLHALEARDICVSTGSACSSHRRKANTVLQAMGVPDQLAECAIRISLAASNTPDEIRIAARAIQDSWRRLVSVKTTVRPAGWPEQEAP